MFRKLKILLVMDPGILVPPNGYGGHERLVYLFAREYSKMGHEVHLLVTSGSEVEGCTVHGYGEEGFPQNPKQVRRAILYAWRFIWNHRNSYDLIHNFGRLLYLLPVFNHRVAKIMTYGREISASNVHLSVRLPNRNLCFTGCSENLIRRNALPGRWKAVYNAIDFSKYQLQPAYDESAPLIFLGRIEKVKGCHTAIQVARKTGSRLLIAGNISPLADEQDYFKKEIEPYIDGEKIIHLGQVNDEQKNHYLRMARALLFPIEWDEPFGIVMIEAMACGTPVIAFNRGSVDEVVKDSISGFKVTTIEQMVQAVDLVAAIDRHACREYAVARFSASDIAKQYLSLFEEHFRKKVLIVTTGQPAANPRVVKEYETLKKAGYHTTVLYTYSAEWSHQIDQEKFFTGTLDRTDFVLAGGSNHAGKITYLLTRVGHRLFRLLSGVAPAGFIKDMSMARSSMALWMKAVKTPADLYIAHYVGALPAAAYAARRYKARYAFDAEDYHRGEPVYYKRQMQDIVEVEDRYLPSAVFITAASPLIVEAYRKHYPQSHIVTLNNVFSKMFIQKNRRAVDDSKLSLFWFSQNIGPHRGLEIIVEAMNRVNADIVLYLLGNAKNEQYFKSLMQMCHQPDRIRLIKPVPPEEVFSIAARYDIGLASELPLSQNRNLCLTNKIFTYLLSGNCILASDTAAQKAFLDMYPGIGLVYHANEPESLAEKLRLLQADRSMLNQYKEHALHVSETVLNWENESEVLKQLVHSVI